MAWWQEITENYRARRRERETYREKKTFSVGLNRVFKTYLYDNFVDFLYISLSVFPYLYIVLSAITFAYQDEGPHLLAYAMEALSEPYLGALAIYVLVKEIERRKLPPEEKPRRRGELFVTVWLMFLIVATTVTYFSEFYHLNGIYQAIVTNSLAAVIIRIGSLLR